MLFSTPKIMITKKHRNSAFWNTDISWILDSTAYSLKFLPSMIIFFNNLHNFGVKNAAPVIFGVRTSLDVNWMSIGCQTADKHLDKPKPRFPAIEWQIYCSISLCKCIIFHVTWKKLMLQKRFLTSSINLPDKKRWRIVVYVRQMKDGVTHRESSFNCQIFVERIKFKMNLIKWLRKLFEVWEYTILYINFA